jgi:hypothetical protein
MRQLALALLLPFVLGGCYLAAGLGDFAPAGEGGEGATAKATSTKANTSSGDTSGTGGAPPGCDHVVITELRAANGDFIELFNPTEEEVPLEGWRIESLTAGGMPQIKWTGTADQRIAPGAYFIMALPTVADRDAILTGFAMSLLTVARLTNAAQQPVDALCICAMPDSGCTHPDFEKECERPLIVPELTVASPYSAQRRGVCADSDDTSADFVAACPTPRADLAAAPAMCP